MYRYVCAVATLWISQALFGQMPGDMPPKAQPGKCYAKCLMYDHRSLDTTYTDYVVYLGSDTAASRTIYHPIYVSDKGRQRYSVIEIARQPDALPEDSVRTHTLYTIFARESGERWQDWREIVCGSYVTAPLVAAVQDALRERGFYQGETEEVMGSETKTALVDFQRAHALPLGQLDFATLAALKVPMQNGRYRQPKRVKEKRKRRKNKSIQRG